MVLLRSFVRLIEGVFYVLKTSISSFKDTKYRKSPQNFTSGEIFKTSAICEGVLFFETPHYPNHSFLCTVDYLIFNIYIFNQFKLDLKTNICKLMQQMHLNLFIV